MTPHEHRQKIAEEFQDSIAQMLESHGISSNSIRVKVGIERDLARRVDEYIIIASLSNEESRNWNN